ncbi:carbohydrate ABC transporter permease [Lacticaseibacillus daqingensis]|uniref:carbohydrate ABC transporter permease n=1 Tax=Lacticaseibacillus daqingensis TaxID=2486014 RepID=UPI000F7BA45F|nr:carbohydrate ABC transporter permease [Lacticaseibacillus daqingensis]
MQSKRRITRTALYLVLGIGLLVFILPYVYMLLAATQKNEVILGPNPFFGFGADFLKNLAEVQKDYNYLRVLGNSILITVVGTLVSMLVTTLAGYVLAKYRFAGGTLIFYAVMLARMVPQFALIIPTFYILSGMGLTNTYTGVILPSVASTTAVFMMRQYALDFPSELMESARIDGASEAQIFWRIAVPVLEPAILTTGLLTFMGYWNAYLFPLIILNDPEKYTVPLIIQNMTQNTYKPLKYGALMAVLATSVVPIVILYMLLQKKFQSNNVGQAIK